MNVCGECASYCVGKCVLTREVKKQTHGETGRGAPGVWCAEKEEGGAWCEEEEGGKETGKGQTGI